MTTSPLDRLLELERLEIQNKLYGELSEEYKSLKSQIESSLSDYYKIKKVFMGCDLITESGNIFIPDLKGLKEGDMVVVDRDEYESKLAQANQYTQLVKAIQSLLESTKEKQD